MPDSSDSPLTTAKKSSALGHRDRLRKRFNDSPESLPEYELLELLLGYALLRKDTKPLAKELLREFKSIRGIFLAKQEELRQVKGIGPGVIHLLTLLHETSCRCSEGPLKEKEVLCTPESVAFVARQRLGKKSIEEIWCAFVDRSNRLISWQMLSRGSIEMSLIAPRDVLSKALEVKASGFILVHNHPGGSNAPSGADISLTNKIKEAATSLGVRFLDHVIVTDTSAYSMVQEQLIL